MAVWDNIPEKLYKLPLLKNIIGWSKTHSLPGFFDIPIYDILVFVWKEVQRDSIVTRANSIAFSFFLSLFPTILVFFTLIPFLLPLFQDYIIPLIAEDIIVHTASGKVDFNQTLIHQFQELLAPLKVIPISVQEQLIGFMENILLKPRFGLLSFSFLLIIFFSSNGMLTLMQGFEKADRTAFVQRSAFKKRLIAIELTFLMGLLVLAALFFIILGNSAIHWLFGIIHISQFGDFMVQVLRVFTVFVLFYSGITFLYRRGMPTRTKLSYFSAGTTLATFLVLITSWGFAIYVNNYSKYNELYGSIGTIIVIMLWIQINAFILLVGFELNASIVVNRHQKQILLRKKKLNEEE